MEMVTGGSKLHVVFIPLLAPGHMIPLVQVARLFAGRGVRSTIITTVHNALTIQTSIGHDIDAGYPLTIHTVNFPASEVGLPVGTESMGACTNPQMSAALIRAMHLLQTPMEQVIRDVAPDCIFSDMFITWTVDIAEELKIPRLSFYPNNCFYHSVSHSLKVHVNVKSESGSFAVPNLPDCITMKRSQVSHHFLSKTYMGDMLERVEQAEKRSYGLVHNTFYEIEPAYVDHLKKIKGTKIWHIGPLFQFFNDKESDDGGGMLDKNSCFTWLDYQKPKSVIYVCFGSMVRFPEAQISEIASALEESNQPFIWVVRKDRNEENIGGMPEGFEERIRRENKGLIITGWAPQVEILHHPSIGAFMSHCGWNSVLEAVTAGVPLITWPLYGEHFYNEKLVELLGIGAGVGADVWNPTFMVTCPIIEKQGILEAIVLSAGNSITIDRIRKNSKKLALKAKMAVKEGGSSFKDLNALIDELKAFKLAKKP